jgi:hypothetical protein
MPLPEAMKKALLDELSKIGDKHVAKKLNEILFREPLQEQAVGLPGNQGTPPNPAGGPGTTNDVVGGSRAMDPTTGPGGA